jgi:hypothetical protein
MMLKFINQCLRQTHDDAMDKNNNVSFEGIDKLYHQYHNPFYQIRCDTSGKAIMSVFIFKLPLFQV